MRHPIEFLGTYPSNWAGYSYKERLGYTSGVHPGVDYNRGVYDLGDPVYAICSGTVVDSRTSGQISGFGNALIIQTDATPPGVVGKVMYHRYLHLQGFKVSKGQKVVQGQQIGTVGATGTSAPHLHLELWTNRNGLGAHWSYHKDTPLDSYEDPFKIITANASWDAGETAMTNAEEANAYQIVLNRAMEHKGSGRTGYQFIIAADAELKAQRTAVNSSITALNKNIADLQTALANEKNKPAEVVTKEVEKIVEKIVNVEVPVEVIKEVNPTWLEKSIEFIRSVLRIK